jgi:hypothetical protein
MKFTPSDGVAVTALKILDHDTNDGPSLLLFFQKKKQTSKLCGMSRASPPGLYIVLPSGHLTASLYP